MSDCERYVETRRQAAIQVDQYLYRQSPALWWLVAIIFGLGLVVYELSQSKQLASAQFAIDRIAREASVQIAMMGKDPREAFAKAALHPSDLNERDVVALDAYYDGINMGWFGMQLASERAMIRHNGPWSANLEVH